MGFEFPKKLPKGWIKTFGEQNLEKPLRVGAKSQDKNRPQGLDPRFGYDGTGVNYSDIQDTITGSKFSCPSAGAADYIKAYLNPGSSGYTYAKFAIYDSSLNKVGETQERTFTDMDFEDWYRFDFSTPKPNLSAGNYWLVGFCSTAETEYFRLYYGAGATYQGLTKSQSYSSGFPNTIESPTYADWKYSIYCVYTETISKTITGTAKINFEKMIGANARIKMQIPKTITGNAVIQSNKITGNARIESIHHYETQLSYRFDRENKARAIAGVANSIGYEWWVNENDILCFFKQRGHNKSSTITLSDDIIAVDQSFDASKIINKLTVVGMGPGSTHLEVTVDDSESQAKYGVMEGVFSEKDIHDLDTLTSFANAALKQTIEAKHRMIIELVGSERTDIELGDIVHVTHPDAGIDGDYRIISMERVSGVGGDSIKLEIAVPQFRVTETIADVGRRADAEDYHPQGAPSILTLARADNVDSTHPLKMKFYVPPEAVDMGKLQIKEAKIALTLEPFRAYSTGAASGGGHTTSAGGGQTSSGGSAHSHTISGQTAESSGGHRHKMFKGDTYVAWSDPTYRYRGFAVDADAGTQHIMFMGIGVPNAPNLYTFEAAGSHTHTVTGTTSSSESSHTHEIYNHTHQVYNHTHDIVYGIYTSTLPADVYIKLNGTQIAGPFNADEYVDITTKFLEEITTYGWNTLEFTSLQLGKIGATLFMRLFLQAN